MYSYNLNAKKPNIYIYEWLFSFNLDLRCFISCVDSDCVSSSAHPSTVPRVLKICSEFLEEHGVVDGIYRLSGVSSNIQKLRCVGVANVPCVACP